MSDSLVFFILGIVFLRVVQELLNIVKVINIFRYAELYSITLLCELEVMRLYCLQIIKLCFEETNREEEYKAVENKINEKFVMAQNNTIQLIKDRLPYKVKYNNLQEAHKEFLNQTGEKKDGERGDD